MSCGAKKFKVIKVLFLVFVFFLSLPVCVQAKNISLKSEPTITVGILTNVQSVNISAAFNYEAAEISKKYPANTQITITNQNGAMAVNGSPVKVAEITIKPQKNAAQPGKYISVNSNKYRGVIKIYLSGKNGGLTVVNSLFLEEYLCGVIKSEIPPEWPLETVKAQTVAARNYALTQRGKHKDKGFEVCATTDCQVYGGQNSETPRVIQAVNETRGIVLTHNGELIMAYYHSSSGGHTENSENVWSASLPYLRGVVDFDQNSPHYKWEKQFNLVAFTEKLKNAGADVGMLKSIELSTLNKQPVNSPDRGVSGRVKTARFTGTKGKAVLDGSRLRSIFGLNSTLFDMKITSNTGKDKGEKQVVITGSGMGHGVGMSQWGAKAMAEKAPSSNKEYYKDILKHYYKNANIVKIY